MIQILRRRLLFMTVVAAIVDCCAAAPATTLNEFRKLTAPVPTKNSNFGVDVSLVDSRILVGANGRDPFTPILGRAYLMDTATGATLRQFASNSASIAVSGNLLIVGATASGFSFLSGSAFLYDVTTGALLHELQILDSSPADELGSAVAIDGRYAVVGAANRGAAYLFDTTTGAELANCFPTTRRRQMILASRSTSRGTS